ncbi:hypothetical protein VTN96DRAFT_1889 [Rasamsonia emersonii]|uniref:Uncharacterized protein n=1 Tax=Rasamsonia emersonii (strain ATCC 16479 / CBS 393.64 / IMI 116815) TaxID=1408163 RepID=A0A0F4YSN7_RASE3|nr:hypothetical protein T310_4673 [Rasamsonia emersonii CBS 393.64]KKA21297.1 hypothetical protein T310_4673 [Rasamsonia emersonii CBS 393.64]
MSPPDSTTNRAFSRRRDDELQHNASPSPSPFHRARRNRGLDEIDTSRIPSPTSKNGARPRRAFGQTRTLKGAFEATSRPMTMADGDDQNTPPVPPAGRTPSPRSRRQRNLSVPSPLAEVTSPPPGELLETYRRINDADDLADLVSQDEMDLPSDPSRRRERGGGLRRLSPVIDQGQEEDEDNFGPGLSFLDDVTDDSMRKKLANHVRDEERLKRVVSRESPVFSKAKVGSKAALSAENLQRRYREREQEQEEEVEDSDDGPKPGLNVPKSWASRSRSHRAWLDSITRKNGNTPRERESKRSVEREVDADIDFTARSLQVSNSPPVRQNLKDREKDAESTTRTASPRNDPIKSELQESQPSTEGEAIPNTPIVVYKASPKDKPPKPRSDSRELLRKLARAESPSQSSTPEQPKPPEKNTLPDKTPVVIGAWVDTPMTERAAESTEDLSREIDSPSKPGPKSNAVSATISTDTTPPESNNNSSLVPSLQLPDKKPETEPKPQPKPETKPEVKTEKPKPELVKPKLPKSALEMVIEDAKVNGNPLVLGDDTINSLQEILDGEDKHASPGSESENAVAESKRESDDAVAGIDATDSELAQHQTETETQRQPAEKDTESLDRMNSKLQSLIHSIHDARTGLDGLEQHISPGGNADSKQREGHCETCGAHDDGRVYVSIPLPRLWRRDPVSQRIHLTYQGWGLLSVIIWYISESTMCDYYCHPTVAEVCDGYCLRPDAPRFPFTIPTMLWRWSHLSVILSPLWTIVVALFRLLAQLLGLWDGYVDEIPALADTPIGSNSYYHYGGGILPPKIVTTTAAAATSPSTPTILQNMVPDRSGSNSGGKGERWYGDGDDGLTMDNDEIL